MTGVIVPIYAPQAVGFQSVNEEFKAVHILRLDVVETDTVITNAVHTLKGQQVQRVRKS